MPGHFKLCRNLDLHAGIQHRQQTLDGAGSRSGGNDLLTDKTGTGKFLGIKKISGQRVPSIGGLAAYFSGAITKLRDRNADKLHVPLEKNGLIWLTSLY